MTVSGEFSMCSIKSQFSTRELWLSRVTLIIPFLSCCPHRRLLRTLERSWVLSPLPAKKNPGVFPPPSEKTDCMPASFSPCCPAAALAKSLLDAWLCGDEYMLRKELEHVAKMPDSPEASDEADRIELLKCIAWRMKGSPDLFALRCESPRTGAWLDLLDHLSAERHMVN